MEEASKKKKYDVLMTEHERRVHDKDIKAYVEMDTQNVYTKIPGVKSHENDLQEKYLEKLFSNNTGFNNILGNQSNIVNNESR